MITIGARETGVKFSLLDKVRNGEEVLITRQGKAVARLVAAGREKGEDSARNRQAKVDETIRKLIALRKEMNLGDLDWKAMRDEGRR